MLAASLVLGTAACSTTLEIPIGNGFDWAEAEEGQGTAGSFFGVALGDGAGRVEERYPNGSVEVSPFGIKSYRVRDCTADGIRYSEIVYEFPDDEGLQVIYARFEDSNLNQGFERWKAALRATGQCQGCSSGDVRGIRATWHTADGGKVLFNGRLRRLAIMGPHAIGLEPEIGLRDESIEPAPK